MKRKLNEKQKKLIELFNEKRIWDSQKAIIERLHEEGITWSQSTISRYLKSIGAEQNDNGQYSLDKISAYEQNLASLSELIGMATDSRSIFVTEIKSAVVKSKPNYNRLLAKKIEETFAEVYSTFCPNDTDIIIYYLESESPQFEKDFSELFARY